MRCRVLRTVGLITLIAGMGVPRPAYAQARLGVATGVTAASIVTPLALTGSTCTGSGDYLRTCRLIFVGSAAAGAGLGFLAARLLGDNPNERASTTMTGAAVGALGAFALSLPFCDQEDADNPDVLCGYDGMVEPGTAAIGAVIGGVVGYLLPHGDSRLEVSQLGPVRAPDGGNTWAFALTLPTR